MQSIKSIFIKRINLTCVALAVIILTLLLSAPLVYPNPPEEKLNSLNLYVGQLSTNEWEEFFGFGDSLNFKSSYLAALTLAHRIGAYKNVASFEVEGQVVKHFNLQDHWELNALVIARWDAFWWDKSVDTSVAFGLGPSFATSEPEIEKLNDGTTSQFLVYWMIELAFALPEYSHIAFITRLHHRSDGYGLIAEKGGSNAITIGLKYRF